MKDAASRLEAAQDFLEAGRPAHALRVLAPRPAALWAGETQFLRAEALRAQGFFDRAAAAYHRVPALARGDRDLRGRAALGLAAVWRSLGKVGPARAAMNAARAAGATGVPMDLESALIERAAGNWKRCLPSLKALLARFSREKDSASAAFVHWALGGARRFSGDLAGGRKDFEASLRLARRAADAPGVVYALFGLAGVSRIQGRLEESRARYAEAGRLLAKTQDIFGKAYAFCGESNALRQLGRLEEARRGYLRSRGLYASLGDAVDLAYVDWGLGKIALARGRLAEADKWLKLALAGFSKGAEARGLVLSEHALAALRHAQGRSREGELLFDQAVRRSRKAGLTAHLEIFT